MLHGKTPRFKDPIAPMLDYSECQILDANQIDIPSDTGSLPVPPCRPTNTRLDGCYTNRMASSNDDTHYTLNETHDES